MASLSGRGSQMWTNSTSSGRHWVSWCELARVQTKYTNCIQGGGGVNLVQIKIHLHRETGPPKSPAVGHIMGVVSSHD